MNRLDRPPEQRLGVDDGTGLDLQRVAEIARRAGLDARADPGRGTLRARGPGGRAARAWTVATVAGRTADGTLLARLGPEHSHRGHVLQGPDERSLAALVLLQALRHDPGELLSYGEAALSGLADRMIWR